MDRGLLPVVLAIAVAAILVFACGGSGICLNGLGEQWTGVFLYPFSHTGTDHLLTNLLALALVGAIAAELGMSWKRFLLVFLAVGWLSAIPFVLAFPSVTFMGLSGGIYGVFGIELLEMRKYRLPSAQILIVFLLATGLSAGIESAYASQLSTGLQLGVHLLALSLGAGMGKHIVPVNLPKETAKMNAWMKK
ncbi:MAG: rhomboid family intramembrane serine protease [Candidatus Hadarchaeales archaeon]